MSASLRRVQAMEFFILTLVGRMGLKCRDRDASRDKSTEKSTPTA
jgi:hypothetical protein